MELRVVALELGPGRELQRGPFRDFSKVQR